MERDNADFHQSRAGTENPFVWQQTIGKELSPLVALEPRHLELIASEVPGGTNNIQDIYPLTPLQEGLLFHHTLENNHQNYVLSTLLELDSRARVSELVQAVQSVIDRHEILRAALLWEGLPRPVHVIYRRALLIVEDLPLEASCSPAEELQQKALRQSWNLRRAPLIRLLLATDPSGSQCYAVLQVHHIICDYGSLRNLAAEVVCHMNGTAPQLPTPSSYRDHVERVLRSTRTEDAEDFFRTKLGNIDEPTAPFNLMDVYGSGAPTDAARQVLEPALSHKLRSVGRSLGIGAARLFHAAWALVVGITSARTDVVFGTVLRASRQRDASTSLLGLSINTLPLRLNLTGVTIRELIEQTHIELSQLLQYKQVPLIVAQRCTAVPASAPLFTTLLNFRHATETPETEWLKLAGVRVLSSPEAQTNYPLALTVDDRGNDFVLIAQADSPANARRILEYVSTALESIAVSLESAPESPALSLSIMPPRELETVLRTFNETAALYHYETPIHALFEDQVQQAPDAIAVVHGTHHLTYDQLNTQANQLASHLRNHGIGPDRLVAICVERSFEMVVGLLGILKAGGAYLPLDPSYPAGRLKYMLEDAEPAVILTQSALSSDLPPTQSVVIELDGRFEEIRETIDPNQSPTKPGLTTDHLAYVIYTSGSTGHPKGIAMTHRPLVNLIAWHHKRFPLTVGTRVLQFAALSFDVAFQEIFSTLCSGGSLILMDEWIRRDPQALTRFLNNHSIQRLFIPPIMLQSLAECVRTTGVVPETLQDIVAAGEQLRITPEVTSLFKRIDSCRLHNHYGPTETHVVTALTLTGDPERWPHLPSIGRPIANTKLYVLDTEQRPVPIGVTGEIYIGGAALAREYLGKPQLTAQRFVKDRICHESASRLFRTGDLGRWREDGLIEYLGRNDFQVKIRGYRIELAEIEAQLSNHADVGQAAVIAREDTPGNKRLAAYITPREGRTPSVDSLRTHLKAVLPDYMVPAAFVTLQRLPLTPNGKLDRRALPVPELEAYANRQYEPPRGEIEEALARIWQDLLQVERVGRDENFFELGGHSLLIMQLILRISTELNVRLPAQDVFRNPDLHALSEAINTARSSVPSQQSLCEAQIDDIVL